MKNRLLRGWTFKRVVYVVVGIATVIMAFKYDVKLMSVAGLYFAAMGLFSFGCAGGSCYTGYPKNNSTLHTSAFRPEKVEFEEIK